MRLGFLAFACSHIVRQAKIQHGRAKCCIGSAGSSKWLLRIGGVPIGRRESGAADHSHRSLEIHFPRKDRLRMWWIIACLNCAWLRKANHLCRRSLDNIVWGSLGGNCKCRSLLCLLRYGNGLRCECGGWEVYRAATRDELHRNEVRNDKTIILLRRGGSRCGLQEVPLEHSRDYLVGEVSEI